MIKTPSWTLEKRWLSQRSLSGGTASRLRKRIKEKARTPKKQAAIRIQMRVDTEFSFLGLWGAEYYCRRNEKIAKYITLNYSIVRSKVNTRNEGKDPNWRAHKITHQLMFKSTKKFWAISNPSVPLSLIWSYSPTKISVCLASSRKEIVSWSPTIDIADSVMLPSVGFIWDHFRGAVPLGSVNVPWYGLMSVLTKR